MMGGPNPGNGGSFYIPEQKPLVIPERQGGLMGRVGGLQNPAPVVREDDHDMHDDGHHHHHPGGHHHHDEERKKGGAGPA